MLIMHKHCVHHHQAQGIVTNHRVEVVFPVVLSAIEPKPIPNYMLQLFIDQSLLSYQLIIDNLFWCSKRSRKTGTV